MKIFQKQSIFSLLDILFNDMTEDHRIFDDPESEEGKDEESSCDHGPPEEETEHKSTDSEGHEEEKKDEDEDPLVLEEVDPEQYLDHKSMLYIERIKDIVGELMASCQKGMKYQILETIMRGVIFGKK